MTTHTHTKAADAAMKVSETGCKDAFQLGPFTRIENLIKGACGVNLLPNAGGRFRIPKDPDEMRQMGRDEAILLRGKKK